MSSVNSLKIIYLQPNEYLLSVLMIYKVQQPNRGFDSTT